MSLGLAYRDNSVEKASSRMEETPKSEETNRAAENPRNFRNWAEVDLNALRSNFRVAAGAGHGVIAIIKADAYGHGAVEVAKTLELEADLEAFGVATLEEALKLRKSGILSPILLLSTALADERETIIKEGFWASISSLKEAQEINQAAEKLGKRALGHIVVDTGMGRGHERVRPRLGRGRGFPGSGRVVLPVTDHGRVPLRGHADRRTGIRQQRPRPDRGEPPRQLPAGPACRTGRPGSDPAGRLADTRKGEPVDRLPLDSRTCQR